MLSYTIISDVEENDTKHVATSLEVTLETIQVEGGVALHHRECRINARSVLKD